MADDGLFPVAVLIDELKNGEMAVRVRATKQLKVIAEALGFERTREELIPYVTEKGGGWDDNDEVLICIAEQFADFLEYVGGPGYASHLLTPLEQLIGMEEPAVRDKGVEAINNIIKQLPDDIIERDYAPIVHRLANHEWAACKAGSAALIPVLYTRTHNPEAQAQLRNLYISLTAVEEPMVKRAAAQNMPEMVRAVNDSAAVSPILHKYVELGWNKQDGVRLIAVEKCAPVARELAKLSRGSELIQKFVLPIVKEAAEDFSWRVRYMLCTQLKDIAQATQLAKQPTDIINIYKVLAGDAEAEVRTAAAHQITNIGLLVSGTREMRDLTPCLSNLCFDSNNHVRAATAANIVGLSQVFSKTELKEFLLPLLTKLLGDESSDVRLNVIGELGKVSETVGFKELAPRILTAVTDLATDSKWRVREGVINVVPSLAKLMGAEAFNADLSYIVIGWLTDQVCEIRVLVAKVLCELWQIFGEKWAKENLLPKILSIASKENYMHRVALLNFVALVASKGYCSSEVINTTFLNLFSSLAHDKVPNVRFNVAKSIEACLPKLEARAITANWRPLLDQLEDDTDIDVRHFARKALVNCP
eukprot:TRINITY_DN6012_c0_g1_i2.p1 TRINITY_DN6012_c0_g1~~TRINITY_DN6012_c0_g1_i2.p1  ORF type:complete len:602 (+),score=236.42 TRINITY_DN6012_c0_g1_i2:34-1806(+)